MSEGAKVEQAAQIVRGRLTETDGVKGLKILGRDALGNWQAESRAKREWDLRAKKEIPAQIIITPTGQSFINQHPGFLRAIDRGDLSPQWTSEKGSSSLVVHPDEFPEVVIKYMRFSPSQTIREWQRPLPPGMSRDLSKNPDATYHMTQVATGIDHLYWKQMVAKVLEAKGMRAATPFLATRDVLVEEHIAGPNLLDFLRQIQQGCSEQEFKQLAESLTEITEPIYEESLEMFREEAAKGEALPYQLPTTFDMTPPNQWKENPIKDGRVVSHSSLANWIVTDEEGGVESLKNLSQAEQQQWFKDRLVLIDPFADFAYLTEEEAKAYQHSIPKTSQSTSQTETAVLEETQLEENSGSRERIIQEKDELLRELEIRKRQNPEISFASTEHFIIVVNNSKPEGVNPKILVTYLESGLKLAMEHFQIASLNTFQYLNINERSRRRLIAQGIHFGKYKDFIHARFNSVYHQKYPGSLAFQVDGEETSYSVVVHEAIGHGFIARVIFGEDLLPSFLEEGLAIYVSHLLSASNPHMMMIDSLVSKALDRFPFLEGKQLNQMTKVEKAIRTRVSSLWDDGDFAIRDFFRLKGKSKTNAAHQPDFSEVSPSYYFRASSFIGYFINRYGIEKFKDWTRGLKKPDFFNRLTQATGKTIEEIEHEWKEEVLHHNFWTQDPKYNKRLAKLTAAGRVQVLREIKELYRAYA